MFFAYSGEDRDLVVLEKEQDISKQELSTHHTICFRRPAITPY